MHHATHIDRIASGESGTRDAASRWERLALFFVALGAVTMVVLLLRRAAVGIDFTDEGFHLNWIAHPEAYPASVTQFGFVYHPLYRVFGGDIARMRQCNLLLTVALAWGMFEALFRTQLVRTPEDRVATAVLGFVFATSSLMLLYQWLPTPNYRSLTLQAMLITGIGALLVGSPRPRTRWFAWVLLGVGGWLVFMSKPTSAGALALIIAATLLYLRHLPPRMLVLTALVAVGLLGISAFVIDGSIPGFVHRFEIGVEDLQRLQGGYTLGEIVRVNLVFLTPVEGVTIAISTALIALGTIASFSDDPSRRRLTAIAVLVLALLSLGAMARLRAVGPLSSSFLGMQFLAILLGTAIAVRQMWRGTATAKTDGVPLWRCFLLLPYAYVFGTNSNYWGSMSPAVVFWVVFGIGLLVQFAPVAVRWWNLLPMAVVAQVVVGAILLSSAELPFRQIRALREQREILRIPATGVTLRVSHEVATYVNRLDSITQVSGFERGTPMLDFTGRFPTALYLIGARPIGLAWLAGGYPGSRNVVAAGLDRVPPEQMRRAWVLAEPVGPRHIPVDLLQRYGLDIERDYDVVGRLRSPMGEYYYRREQVLYRPRGTAIKP